MDRNVSSYLPLFLFAPPHKKALLQVWLAIYTFLG